MSLEQIPRCREVEAEVMHPVNTDMEPLPLIQQGAPWERTQETHVWAWGDVQNEQIARWESSSCPGHL